MHTDKAHRLRIVTCKRDREAIARKCGEFGEANSDLIRGWMESTLNAAMDQARSDLNVENERDVANAVGPATS